MSDDWKVTACTHDCPCACPLLARERGGTVEIRAYDAGDAGKGSFVCMKGLRFAKRLDDPRRILRPLLRSGSGFEEVSWDHALDIWADKITDAISDFGPLSVMSLPGSGSLSFSKQLVPAFYSALGGCTATKGNLCSAVGSAGLRESTLGFGVPFLSPDILLSAKGLLLWGRNVRHTHPRLVPILEERRSLGRETACIDVRLSATASRCDRFWCIVPGSDWALAAWLCERLLRDGRDCGGWRGRAVNAAAFLRCAEGADPDFLLAQTGLSRDSAEEIYLWLLDNAPAAHMLAFGAQRYLHGDLQFRWIFALSVLSGAFEDARAGLSFSKDETALFPKDLFEPPRNVRRFGIAAWPRDILSADPPVRVMNI
ncbi:MAG: molybdopterin-dependent oxidoreductase, partial [Synergistes sp.]|nr:molybdopterin-dependent oxidoreductase [Synergistes sp.]